MLDQSDITEMLKLRGDEQEQLFAQARIAREQVFQRKVVLRGVTEIGNKCRVNCEFCPMRRDNTRENDSFIADADDLVNAAEAIHQHGINVVFFQAGEIPQTTKVVGDALPRIKEIYGGDVEVLLNLGNKKRSELEYLREQGADSYILKHETSDPHLNLQMRHETLDSRLQCMSDLVELGYKVGTGGIIGLPGQSIESIAGDMLLADQMGAHMCSFAPFVPAPNTPLEHLPKGSVDMTLNAIAVSRLLRPDWLIPSVSALAKNKEGGQQLGFLAGANVMTVNFTNHRDSSRYLIYGKDRFVVRSDYTKELLSSLDLSGSRSVFVGAEAMPELDDFKVQEPDRRVG